MLFLSLRVLASLASVYEITYFITICPYYFIFYLFFNDKKNIRYTCKNSGPTLVGSFESHSALP